MKRLNRLTLARTILLSVRPPFTDLPDLYHFAGECEMGDAATQLCWFPF